MCKELNLCFIILILASLSERSVNRPLSQDDLKRAIVIDIGILAKYLEGAENRLYAPEFTEICARQALECYMKETNVLAQENEGDDNITSTISKIQRNINAAWRGDPVHTNECRQCESYKEKKIGAFFKDMITFVQLAF